MGYWDRLLGDIHVQSGASVINTLVGGISIAPTSSLTMASLTREPGATLNFRIFSSDDVYVSSPLVLDDGIVGGWATANSDYATIVNGEIVPFTGYATNINAASASDNVFADGNLALTSNRNINSLVVDPGTVLNLNQKTLNIESGGILRPGYDIAAVAINPAFPR